MRYITTPTVQLDSVDLRADARNCDLRRPWTERRTLLDSPFADLVTHRWQIAEVGEAQTRPHLPGRVRPVCLSSDHHRRRLQFDVAESDHRMRDFAILETPQSPAVLATTMTGVLHLATTSGAFPAQSVPGIYTSSDIDQRLRRVRGVDQRRSTAAELLHSAAEGNPHAITTISTLLMSNVATSQHRSAAA